MKQLTWHQLERKTEDGVIPFGTWLDTGKCKVGDRITLKNYEAGEDLLWDVIAIKETVDSNNIKDSHNSEKWHKNDYRRRLKGKLI